LRSSTISASPGAIWTKRMSATRTSMPSARFPDGMKGRLERPDAETINFILERFIANTVTKRIENAIGNDMITLPETGLSARELQRLFQDWVSGRVKDAMTEIGGVLRQDQVRSQIDMIYEEAHASFGNYDEKDDEQ
jgi:hypothetical protein